MTPKAMISSVVILSAILAFVFVAVHKSPVIVDTAVVHRGQLQVTITQEARTRVRNRYVIAAPVTGLLQRIYHSAGDEVEKGVELAHIYPAPEFAHQVQVAQEQIVAAEARAQAAVSKTDELHLQIDQLQRDVIRTRALVEKNVIEKKQLEQEELALATAQQQQKAATAQLRAANADIVAAKAMLVGELPSLTERTPVTVLAPCSGKILAVMEESQRVVLAGTPLLSVGNAAQLEAVIEVLSAEAVRISKGDRVEFYNWGGDATVIGTVRIVEPEAFTKISALGVEEQRVNIIATIDDPPATLGSGYRLEANIIVWTGTNVLQVPSNALFRNKDTWHVFVIVDGRAVRRALKIGHQAAEAAEVLDGLIENDTVILFPGDDIADGVLVSGK